MNKLEKEKDELSKWLKLVDNVDVSIEPEIEPEDKTNDMLFDEMFFLATGKKKLNEWEKTPEDMKKVAAGVGDASNPVIKSTLGKDQDSDDVAIDATYSPKDIDALSELKKEIYDLECEIAKMDGTETSDATTNKIKKLKEKFDKISDGFGKGR